MITMKTNLIEAAKLAAKNAYAPYSRICFGAAVETESGDIFSGANIENASYGATMCAERVAIYKAVSAGHTMIKKMALYYGKEVKRGAITPCGLCRQVMSEFCDDMEIIVVQKTTQTVYTFSELFKKPFNKHTIRLV